MKLKTILTIIGAAVVSASCLDTKPEDFTSPLTWYKTEKQLNTALAGVYDALKNTYAQYLSVQFSAGTDECFSKESSPQMQPYYYNYDTSDGNVTQTWRELYKGIDNANVLLENISNSECDEAFNRRVCGEALFLRGYYHFILASYWGDVPLKLSSTTSAVVAQNPREPRARVFDAAISDMTESLDMVDDLSTIGYAGRVSKQAVKGILARAYLYAADFLSKPEYYEKSRYYSKSLIDEGSCELLQDYSKMFIDMMQDKYNIKESIFEVECYGNVDSNESKECGIFPSFYSPQYTKQDYATGVDAEGKKISIARGRGYFYVTPRFYDSFEDGDLRRDWTIMPYFYQNDSTALRMPYNAKFRFRWPGKFRREYEINLPVYSWGNSTNYPLLRYSDVLLMFAEADNRVNNGSTAESLEAVNQVRRRAFGKKYDESDNGLDLEPMTENQFMEYLKVERARELAFEGHRRLDLLRWGIFYDYMHEIGEEIAAIPLQDGKNPIFFQNGSGFPSTAENPSGVEIMARSFRNVDRKHCLMPIPSEEMLANKAITENNPGW